VARPEAPAFDDMGKPAPDPKAAPEEGARVTAMIRYRRCSAPAETGRLPEIEP